jgi:phage terminase small subunit
MVAITPAEARSAEASGVSAIPPEDLPPEQRDFWHRYARLAIEARTLTPRTVAAFRLLCELDAEQRATKKTIEHDGRTFVKVTIDGAGQEHQELKAHPLTSAYRQLAQRVEALMARFSLAPFGKPVEGAVAKKPTFNPWANVASK